MPFTMLTFLIIIIVIILISYNSKTENKVSPRFPRTEFIPKQIQAHQQLSSAVSAKEILTYFCYDNEIVELRFANGKTFKKKLTSCSFQLSIDRDGFKKRGRRVVQERIGPRFFDVNTDWAVTELPILSPQEWDRIFSILKSAGTTYGSL